jgi:excinuclease ABC subunit B
VDGRVIFYADEMTSSMVRAIQETNRRRNLQKSFNELHGITPESIKKDISDILSSVYEADYVDVSTVSEPVEEYFSPDLMLKEIKSLRKQMDRAAKRLDFEEAARIRDRIFLLERKELDYRDSPQP